MIKQAKQNDFNKLGEKFSKPDTGNKPFWRSLLNKMKYTNIPPPSLKEINLFPISKKNVRFLITIFLTSVKYMSTPPFFLLFLERLFPSYRESKNLKNKLLK